MRFQTKNLLFSVSYAALAGLVAFMSFVGWRPLLPSNIAWLENGDPATFYLGWQFFRKAEWTLPIGLNQDYGLELSSSILFSDSIPLLAILFKLFSNSLPEVFQYFGLWLLLCFALQAWFAYKLMGLISQNNIICALGATLFVCAPPMIWRIQGHFALAAHFFILAGLYLALSSRLEKRLLSWTILLALAALVHPYLLAMTGIIWIADCSNRYLNSSLRFRQVFYEFAIVLLITTFACWQAGYFVIGDGVAAEGYGYYRMNLLSIFSAQGFSYVLKNVPMASGDYEGLNFLGLGVILLALFSIGHISTMPLSVVKTNLIIFFKKWQILIWMMLALTLFALSNRIGIASYNLGFYLPESILNAANIFRASGRMFWPAYYLILLAVIYLVLRIFSVKLSIALLGFAICVQYIDTSNTWLDIRGSYRMPPSMTWENKMRDPFWKDAAKKYSKVQVLMPGNLVENWKSIAYFANVHALSTDAIYLGRVGSEALKRVRQQASEMMLSGNYDPNSLYFINESEILFDSHDSFKLPIQIDSNKDLLARIDGYIILAPGWKLCVDCSTLPAEISAQDLLPPAIELNKQFIIGSHANSRRYLYGGWSIPENEGVWSNKKTAKLILPLNNVNVDQIVFEAKPLISKNHIAQKIEVIVNGVAAPLVTMTEGTGNKFIIEITKEMRTQLNNNNRLSFQFNFLDAVSPQALGINNDTRELAIRLQGFTVVKNKPK